MNLSSRNKELFKNTILFAVSNFASKLLVFLMIPLYTSVLSTEDYGFVDVISTTVLLLLPIFTLTISEAVLRFCLSNRNEIKDYLTIGLIITMIGSVMVLAITFISVLLFDFNNLFLYIPFLFLIQSFSRLFGRFARGVDKVEFVAVAGVLETFSIVVCNLLFLLVLKIGIKGYLLSMVIGYSVSCLYLLLVCKIHENISFTTIKKRQINELCKYSLPLIPNQLCWWLIDSFSKYIVMFYVGYSGVGVYTAAFKFPTVLNVISSFFVDAWVLSVIKEYEKPDVKDYIRKVNTYYSFIMIFMALAITCLSKEIACVFLKGEFFYGYIYIPIMCLTAAIGSQFAFFSSLFSSEKKTYLALIPTISGAIMVVLMSYTLVPLYGVMGIVVATLVGYIAIWILTFFLSNRIVNWNIPKTRFALELMIIGLSIYAATNDLVVISYICLILYVVMNWNKIHGVVSLIKKND